MLIAIEPKALPGLSGDSWKAFSSAVLGTFATQHQISVVPHKYNQLKLTMIFKSGLVGTAYLKLVPGIVGTWLRNPRFWIPKRIGFLFRTLQNLGFLNQQNLGFLSQVPTFNTSIPARLARCFPQSRLGCLWRCQDASQSKPDVLLQSKSTGTLHREGPATAHDSNPEP